MCRFPAISLQFTYNFNCQLKNCWDSASNLKHLVLFLQYSRIKQRCIQTIQLALKAFFNTVQFPMITERSATWPSIIWFAIKIPFTYFTVIRTIHRLGQGNSIMKTNDPEKNLFVEICLCSYQTNDKFELSLALLSSITEL